MSELKGKELAKAKKAYAEFESAAEAFKDAMRKFEKKCPDLYYMVGWMEDVDNCLSEMEDIITLEDEE